MLAKVYLSIIFSKLTSAWSIVRSLVLDNHTVTNWKPQRLTREHALEHSQTIATFQRFICQGARTSCKKETDSQTQQNDPDLHISHVIAGTTTAYITSERSRLTHFTAFVQQQKFTPHVVQQQLPAKNSLQ